MGTIGIIGEFGLQIVVKDCEMITQTSPNSRQTTIMSGEWSVKLFTLYETFEKDINCQYMSHFRLNQFDETKTEIVYL